MSKICILCKERKKLDDFFNHPNAKDKKQSKCKKCSQRITQEWTKKNRDKANVWARKHRLKKLYNLTEEDYQQLLEKQKFKCLICKQLHSLKKPLAVDHCHESGKIRGLLCRPCNNAIGLLKHNTENLISAIKYLNEF